MEYQIQCAKKIGVPKKYVCQKNVCAKIRCAKIHVPEFAVPKYVITKFLRLIWANSCPRIFKLVKYIFSYVLFRYKKLTL
jgi:hypothetical protein